MFYAAQVAEPFLADIANKQNICFCFNILSAHGFDDAEHQNNALRIIANTGRIICVAFLADFHICFDGEDCINMGDHGDCLLAIFTGTARDDIADVVYFNVSQAGTFEQCCQMFPAIFFTKRRGRDFGELYERFDIFLTVG